MRWLSLATVLLLCSCSSEPLPGLPAPEPLPILPVEQLGPPASIERSNLFPDVPEMLSLGDGLPVTLNAANVDVRALIPVIAEAAGISVVIGPEVEGRLSVQLNEIPALVALRAILDEAGLTLIGATAPRLWGPVVFYTLPVNIQDASVELIQERFGVSQELAEMTVSGYP